MNMMYKCREIVDLVSLELDQKLPLLVRLKMTIHLSMCHDCRTYRDQIHHVETLISSFHSAAKDETELKLSEESKKAIEEKIQKALE